MKTIETTVDYVYNIKLKTVQHKHHLRPQGLFQCASEIIADIQHGMCGKIIIA